MNNTLLKIFAPLIFVGWAGSANAGVIFLDMDSPATGSNLGVSPLVTPQGTITFAGDFRSGSCSDDEFIAAGASGGCLNGGNGATLSFDFDVSSVEFIYGGNIGNITVLARDIVNATLDSFFQADTGFGQPAGPVTLSGTGIRSLWWNDTGGSYAVLDNITITTSVPLPAPLALLGLGLLGLGWSQRKRR